MPALGPKIKLICQSCNKPFIVIPSKIDHKYCSKPCADKGKTGKPNIALSKPKIDKVCIYCGKPFQAFPFMATRARFCSRSCASSSHVGENAFHWKGGKIAKNCVICGETFSIDPCEVNRLKCCSRKCQSEWQSKYRSGENSPSWQGGISFEPYPIAFDKQFRRMIRKRDNYTCKICGKHGKDVHHINYVKDDIGPNNLITLCHSCHMKTNYHREYWQHYFTSTPYKMPQQT